MSTDLIHRIYLTTVIAAALMLLASAWLQSDLAAALAAPRQADEDIAEPLADDETPEPAADPLADDAVEMMVANTFDPEATEPEGSGAADGSGTAAALVEPPPARIGTEDEPCGFVLSRHAVARHIERREPEDTEGPFVSDGQPIYVYLDADNRGGEPQLATARLVHLDTGLVVSGSTEVGISSRWRTWVELVLPATHLGTWRAEVMDRDRCQLVAVEFEMVPMGWE